MTGNFALRRTESVLFFSACFDVQQLKLCAASLRQDFNDMLLLSGASFEEHPSCVCLVIAAR